MPIWKRSLMKIIKSDGKFTKENNYGLDELEMRGGKYEKAQ